jgi:hypothetical protein
VRDFLKENSLDAIIRAHECIDAIRHSATMPVITVFSASNYDAGTANRSGVLEIGPQGEFTEHRYAPLERMPREDASFFTFAPRKSSDTGVGRSGSIGRPMPQAKPSLAYIRSSTSFYRMTGGPPRGRRERGSRERVSVPEAESEDPDPPVNSHVT